MMMSGSESQENPEQAELNKINQYRTTVSASSGVKPSKEAQNEHQQIPLKKAELNAQFEPHNKYQHSKHSIN